jgi:hypothetical protein
LSTNETNETNETNLWAGWTFPDFVDTWSTDFQELLFVLHGRAVAER